MIKKLVAALSFRTPKNAVLLNKRTKEKITTSLYATKNVHDRARGLMFRKLAKGEGLLFDMQTKMTISLHMYFVFRPIDVLILEEVKEGLLVLEKKEGFKPFSAYTSKKKAKLFLELPQGATKNVREKDVLIPPKDI